MVTSDSTSEPARPPRVFVSYAHETAAHNDWVKSLVKDLRGRGVDAIFDEYRVPLGGDFTLFMDSMRTCNRVLLLCTPTYARKANEGSGGSQNLRVLRGGSWDLNPGDCRSANRDRASPAVLVDIFGFRVALGT